MWQAAIPVGLAGLDMIMQGIRRADDEKEFKKKKRSMKQDALADMYSQYAGSMGANTMGFDAQRQAKKIDELELPEQGMDPSGMINALGSAGMSIADAWGGDGPWGVPEGVDEEDADFGELLQRARRRRPRNDIGGLGDF